MIVVQTESLARMSVYLRRGLGKLRKAPLLAQIGLVILLFLAALAILGDFAAPADPLQTSLPNRLMPPFWADGGSLSHLMGTDGLGRDILSRIISATRAAFLVGLLTLVVGAGIGTTVGLISGYAGGRIDAILMRITDITLAFPLILLALLMAAALGPSLVNVVLSIGVVLWARFARVIRAEVLSLREKEFVAMARVVGCSSARIIGRHLFPNVAPTFIVLITFQLGWVIIVEGTLSFLGAGVPPPTPSWGSMIHDGADYVATAWWVAAFPGFAMLIMVLALNVIGDWLRDVLDPKRRKV